MKLTRYTKANCTRYGYIDTVDGLYGSLEFRYVPALPIDVAAYRDSIRDKVNRVEIEPILAKFTTERIAAWDLCEELPDGTTKALPVTADNMLLMPPRAYNHLADIVFGERLSDKRPGQDKPDNPEGDSKN